jgi:predicted RNA-binding protein with PUA domain
VEGVGSLQVAAPADFGVASDGAEAVVAEVFRGQAGVAEFILDDGAGGVA